MDVEALGTIASSADIGVQNTGKDFASTYKSTTCSYKFVDAKISASSAIRVICLELNLRARAFRVLW